MSDETNINEISLYLIKIKKLLSSGKYDFVPRKKNLDSLSMLGLTIEDVKDSIFELVEDDYYNGPKEDYDQNRNGEIWVFKKNIEGYKFYIKLKIAGEDNNTILKCISFHKDKYKEGGDEIL